ncbi:MAG: peptidylprolyl isomerase [Roseobacter sp.]
MQKHLTLVAAVMLAAQVASPLQAQEATDISPDTVVATVNGQDITLGHMIAARATLPEQFDQAAPQDLYNGILQQLIQQTALAQRIDTLPPLVALTLENEERSLKAGEAVEAALLDAVTDEDLQAAYDAQYANVEPQEEYNASHILLETEEEAIAAIEEIEGGAEFATVAREKSTGPSGPNGGELGWFGAGMMVPSFESAVIALEVGEVSAPVQTQFGWHVITLNDARKQSVPTLDEVREELLTGLRNEAARTIITSAPDDQDVILPELEGIDPAILIQRELLE